MKTVPYRLRDVIRQHAAGISVGILLTVFTVSIQLGLPFIIRHLVDALTEGALTRRDLLAGVLLYAVFIPPAAVVSYWMRRLPLRAAHNVEYTVRRDLFAHLTRQDAAFFNRQRVGDLMTRMGSDLSIVRDSLGHGILHGSRSLIVLLIGFGILFRMRAGFAAALLSLMFCMVLSFTLLLRAIRRRHTALQEQTSDLGHTIEETFSGIRTIKGFALETRRRSRFAAENDGMRSRSMSLSWVSEPIWPMFVFWFSLQLVVTLVYGGRLVLQEEMTLGDLVLVNQYLLYMQWPVLSLGWIGNLLQRARTSWLRLQVLFNSTPSISDDENTDNSITQLSGGICFHQVSLQLDGQTVLDNINLSVPAGATLGITGPTGSGKSVLVSLIARLRDPDTGYITIDGHPLSVIPLDALRNHIGFAGQEATLFSDTLAANLAFGLPERQMDSVRSAAQAAHLDGDISQFPHGYETLVGERGVTLSGGQRQRTALGRAIARQPAILILDDVLSAVDTQTEAAILNNLNDITRNRTTLIVSHRLSTLCRADQVIVLNEGRVVEQGAHTELLSHNGYYAATYHLQQFEGDPGRYEEASP